MIRSLWLAAGLVAVLASSAFAGTSSSTAVNVRPKVVTPKTTITATPSAPVVDCEAAPGLKVATITVATSGGAPPVTGVTLSGDTTDFALSGFVLTAPPPVDIVVGQNGISQANCGRTNIVTITTSP